MRINGSDWQRGLPPLTGGHPESPLEELFLHEADKYLSRLVTICLQEEISTPHGLFRLDFLFRADRQKPVAVECDGAGSHLGRFEYDRWRDAAILAWTKIRVVVRVQGRRLYRYPTAVWFAIGREVPWLFGEGAEQVLRSAFRGLDAEVHERRIRSDGYAWDDALAWDPDLVSELIDESGDLIPIRLTDREVVDLADLSIHSDVSLASEIAWLRANPMLSLRAAMRTYEQTAGWVPDR